MKYKFYQNQWNYAFLIGFIGMQTQNCKFLSDYIRLGKNRYYVKICISLRDVKNEHFHQIRQKYKLPSGLVKYVWHKNHPPRLFSIVSMSRLQKFLLQKEGWNVPYFGIPNRNMSNKLLEKGFWVLNYFIRFSIYPQFYDF